jgi:hypothetical protein
VVLDAQVVGGGTVLVALAWERYSDAEIGAPKRTARLRRRLPCKAQKAPAVKNWAAALAATFTTFLKSATAFLIGRSSSAKPSQRSS